MSPAEELEELIAAWQVEAIDEAGTRRLEALLLADESARLVFARRCREDLALRQLCQLRANAVDPGPETQRLMAQRASGGHRRPGGGTGTVRRRVATGSGPNRRPSGSSGRLRPTRRIQRPRRGRPSPAVGIGAGLAAVVLLVVLILVAQGPEPMPQPAPVPAPAPVATAPEPAPAPGPVTIAHLRELRGTAEHYREEAITTARAGLALSSGDRVLLDPAARGAIELADGTRFALDAGADVLTHGDRAGFTLLLATGTADAVVATQAAGRRVAIRTPEGTVSVVGTAFSVESGDTATRVAVREGLVRAEAHSGEHLMVAAGQVAIISGGRVRYEDPDPPEVTTVEPLPPVPEPPPQAPEPPPEVIAVGVTSFTLISTQADAAIPGFDPIAEDAVIDRKAIGTGKLSMLANVTGPVLSVRFWIDGRPGMLEQFVPYALLGDRERDYKIWNPPPGTYVIEAQAYRDLSGHQAVGPRARVRVTVR